MTTRRSNFQAFMEGSILGLLLLLASTLVGCAYALPPVTLATQVRLKIVATVPDVYDDRLRITEPIKYHVPADGRVTLDVPAYRAGCSVYLFGKLKMQNHSDPYTAKTLDILAGGKTVQQLSLKNISTLPVDVDGYHVLLAPGTK
jgi:hypothetical protein